MYSFRIALALAALLASTAARADDHEQADIVSTALKAGGFDTLIAAVKAAGLVEVLQGEGPLTLFAPTDEAFEKLPKGTVESLLKAENKEKLASILKYHVVAGTYPAAKVVEQDELKTLQGESARVRATEKGVTVDKARVVKTDISASNGIIHAIDTVILPSNKQEATRRR